MLIFLDLQTTGDESAEAICAVALLSDENLLYNLVNEGKKITPHASSIHNITNEMIRDAAAFREGDAYKYLQKHNQQANILVTHNAPLHMQMLDSHGICWQGDVIDTMRVAKHLFSDSELFSLQYLRYEMKLYRQEEQLKRSYGIKCAFVANEAKSSVCITKLLFDSLSEMVNADAMKKLSLQKVLLSKIPFGKYQGHYIEEIKAQDPRYLQWMLGLAELDEDLRYSLEYYLQG